MMKDPKCQGFIEPSEISLLEAVGRGSFGVVHKANWRNEIVAVKIIEIDQNHEEIQKEVDQLSQLDHPHIIKLFGISILQSAPSLLMEFADCGSLQKILHNQKELHYTYAHAITWMLHSAKAVDYLHSMTPKPLMHRDLKPLNMLMFKCGTVLKVCDFGTVCTAHTIMTHNKGSAPWMAPEVFQGSQYSEKCDVYSFAIIMWEIMTRREPYDHMGAERRSFTILWQVSTGKRPPLIRGIPKVLEKLMTSCWAEKPADRPSFKEIVKKLEYLYQFCEGANNPLQGLVEQSSQSEQYSQTSVNDHVSSQTSINDHFSTASALGTVINISDHTGMQQDEMMPIPPMQSSKQSIRIYEEHSRKLERYLEVVKEISVMKGLLTELDEQIVVAETEEEDMLKEVDKLTSEKAKMVELQKDLEFQLNWIDNQIR